MNADEHLKEEAGKIELKGSDDPTERVAYLTALLNHAETKVNHIDGIRQNQLLIALAIFAGISTFVLQGKGNMLSLCSGVTLTLLMIVLTRGDYILQKYSRGWQVTRRGLVQCIANVLNSPKSDVTFFRYDKTGEQLVKFFVMHRIQYFCMVAGGLASYVASLWVK